MKKVIIATAAIASTVVATTALVSKAKKVKAEKAEAIELEKIAADIDATTETVVDDSEISWEDSHETYESESVPVTDEEELEMCEDSVNTYEAEEDAEEVEEEPSVPDEMYQLYVEYCPRVEDGEVCKTTHDTRLKCGEIKYTGIFIRKNNKDVEKKASRFDWNNHDGIFEAINEYFAYSEWLTERDLKFTIDFVGYDWGSPLIMCHVGSDPARSILIRANEIDEDNVY